MPTLKKCVILLGQTLFRCHVSSEYGDSVLKVDKTVRGSLSAGEEPATNTVSLHYVEYRKEEACDYRGWSSGENEPSRSI